MPTTKTYIYGGLGIFIIWVSSSIQIWILLFPDQLIPTKNCSEEMQYINFMPECEFGWKAFVR